MGADRLPELLGALRAAGGRVTSSRRAILAQLVAHQGHPTAEELTAAVQRDQPDLAASTVYRLLDDLERLGLVDHVHLGHGPAVYHFADDEHHHAVCEGCGAVVELPASALAPVRHHLMAELGFELDPRHFALSGRCRRCRSGEPGSTAAMP